MSLAEREQEMDVWWGGNSPWTLLPSFLVCVVLSGMIGWMAWLFLPRGMMQLTVLTLVGLVWLVQILRLAFRLFGYNYRLTNYRLFKEKGMFWRQVLEVDLAKVAKVQVRRNQLERRLGVGRIFLAMPGSLKDLVVLEGVTAPESVAEEIRQRSERAKARGKGKKSK